MNITCKNIINNIPAESQVSHWSAIEIPQVAADICDASYVPGMQGFTAQQKHGSALWFRGKNTDPGFSTGFGIFKGVKGNLVYIIDRGQKGGNLFKSLNLMPENTRIIKLDGKRGNGANEWKAERIVGRVQWLLPYDPAGLKVLKELGVPENQNGYFMDKDGFYCYLPRVLKAIDESAYSKIIPICFEIQRDNAESIGFQERLQLSVAITTALISVVPGLGVASNVISKIGNTLLNLANQSNTVLQNLGNSVGDLAAISNLLAPQYVKGITSTWNGITGTFSTYLNDAKNALEPIFQNASDITNFQKAGAILGLSPQSVKDLWNNYGKPLNSAVFNVDQFVGSNLTVSNKKFQNAVNILLVDSINRNLKDKALSPLIESVGASRSVTSIPILQELFISGGVDSTIGQIPNVADLNSKIITTHSNMILAKDNGADLIAGLGSSVLGYIPPKKIFNEWSLESILNKAEDYAKQTAKNIPFLMPASVDPELVDCFDSELRANGFNTQICRSGYTWDAQKKACVRGSAFVFFPAMEVKAGRVAFY